MEKSTSRDKNNPVKSVWIVSSIFVGGGGAGAGAGGRKTPDDAGSLEVGLIGDKKLESNGKKSESSSFIERNSNLL